MTCDSTHPLYNSSSHEKYFLSKIYMCYKILQCLCLMNLIQIKRRFFSEHNRLSQQHKLSNNQLVPNWLVLFKSSFWLSTTLKATHLRYLSIYRYHSIFRNHSISLDIIQLLGRPTFLFQHLSIFRYHSNFRYYYSIFRYIYSSVDNI